MDWGLSISFLNRPVLWIPFDHLVDSHGLYRKCVVQSDTNVLWTCNLNQIVHMIDEIAYRRAFTIAEKRAETYRSDNPTSFGARTDLLVRNVPTMAP